MFEVAISFFNEEFLNILLYTCCIGLLSIDMDVIMYVIHVLLTNNIVVVTKFTLKSTGTFVP